MQTITTEQLRLSELNRRKRQRERFTAVAITTDKLFKSYNCKKFGLRLQVDIMNGKNNTETINIDASDFFLYIPETVVNNFLQDVFIAAQVRKLEIEQSFV